MDYDPNLPSSWGATSTPPPGPQPPLGRFLSDELGPLLLNWSFAEDPDVVRRGMTVADIQQARAQAAQEAALSAPTPAPVSAQPSTAGTIDTTPRRTTAPAAAPTVTSPPSSDEPPTLDEFLNQGRAAYEAATYRAPVRAVKLPSGKIQFTNREPEPGDDTIKGEIPYSAGIATKRLSSLTPTGSMLTGLMKMQADAARRSLAPEGAVSMIPGTRSQQTQIALEDAMGATALAQAESARRIASMSPMAQAVLASPSAVAAIGLQSFFGPKMAAIRNEADQKIAAIRANVKDPKEQMRQIAIINNWADEALRPYTEYMASGARQRIPNM